MLLGGYAGKILRVNLTSGKVSSELLSEEFARKYLGGWGTAGRILYDEVPPSVAPLDPENLLIFNTGPLTGTMVHGGAGRHTVVAKSPLTGWFGDSEAGGYWGAELKFTGHDMVIISGKSPKPVLLFIDDDTVEIRDASSYWGTDTIRTDREITKDLGDSSIKVACIGIGGENLGKMAGIMSDGGLAIAARCGLGAVMGSKNLKAVAVRGHKQLDVHDPEALNEFCLKVIETARTNKRSQEFNLGGTSGTIVAQLEEEGDAPTYNWCDGNFGDPKVRNLSWKDLKAEPLAIPGGYGDVIKRKRSCFACAVHCRRVVDTGGGQLTKGPEFETLGLMGTNLGIDDIKTIIKLNQLCDEYGIDTMSVGSTISFAMECYHRGLITKADTDGLDLDFGNKEAAIEIIHRIAARKGFGNILAEGSKRASQIIGKGSEDYAVQVKGMDIPAHDPRRSEAGGPHYACTPTGGRHTEGSAGGWERGQDQSIFGVPLKKPDSLEGVGLAVAAGENWTAFIHCAGYCFLAYALGQLYPNMQDMAKAYTLVTGVPVTVEDALMIGERIFTLKKAFNMRHGCARADDTLPKRLTHHPNRRTGTVIHLDKTLPDYYKARGWNPDTSIPTREKFVSVGLEDMVDDFYGAPSSSSKPSGARAPKGGKADA